MLQRKPPRGTSRFIIPNLCDALLLMHLNWRYVNALVTSLPSAQRSCVDSAHRDAQSCLRSTHGVTEPGRVSRMTAAGATAVSFTFENITNISSPV